VTVDRLWPAGKGIGLQFGCWRRSQSPKPNDGTLEADVHARD